MKITKRNEKSREKYPDSSETMKGGKVTTEVDDYFLWLETSDGQKFLLIDMKNAKGFRIYKQDHDGRSTDDLHVAPPLQEGNGHMYVDISLSEDHLP